MLGLGFFLFLFKPSAKTNKTKRAQTWGAANFYGNLNETERNFQNTWKCQLSYNTRGHQSIIICKEISNWERKTDSVRACERMWVREMKGGLERMTEAAMTKMSSSLWDS